MSLIRHILNIRSPLFIRSLSSTPSVKDIYYTTEHETVQTEDNENIVKIGISDYAKETLGDIVFLEAEVEVNDTFEKNDALVTIESVKASSEVFAPFDGEVIEINEIEDVDIIKDQVESDTWFVKCKIENISDLNDLMRATEYIDFVSKK